MGRSFLRATQSFLIAVQSIASRRKKDHARFLRFRPPESSVADITVWRELLIVANASRSLVIDPLVDPDMWVDASSEWGIAIVMSGHWRAWKLHHWKSDKRDIGWAESVALEHQEIGFDTGTLPEPPE
jgi:hypothetical protein